jgi:hypothetical protein
MSSSTSGSVIYNRPYAWVQVEHAQAIDRRESGSPAAEPDVVLSRPHFGQPIVADSLDSGITLSQACDWVGLCHNVNSYVFVPILQPETHGAQIVVLRHNNGCAFCCFL